MKPAIAILADTVQADVYFDFLDNTHVNSLK